MVYEVENVAKISSRSSRSSRWRRVQNIICYIRRASEEHTLNVLQWAFGQDDRFWTLILPVPRRGKRVNVLEANTIIAQSYRIISSLIGITGSSKNETRSSRRMDVLIRVNERPISHFTGFWIDAIIVSRCSDDGTAQGEICVIRVVNFS